MENKDLDTKRIAALFEDKHTVINSSPEIN